MITTIKLMNKYITSCSYSFYVVKTFRIYFTSKFQLYTTVLLTILIMLYIRTLN